MGLGLGRVLAFAAAWAVVSLVAVPGVARAAACDPGHAPERVVVSVDTCGTLDRQGGLDVSGETETGPESDASTSRRTFYLRQPGMRCEDVFGQDVEATARYGKCCKQGRKAPCLEKAKALRYTPLKGFGDRVFLVGPTYRSGYTWGLDGTLMGTHGALRKLADLLSWRLEGGLLRHFRGERADSGYAGAGLCYGFLFHACVTGGVRHDGVVARGDVALEMGLGFLLGLDVRHLVGAEKPEYGVTLRLPFR
jgi:hypothetical protein